MPTKTSGIPVSVRSGKIGLRPFPLRLQPQLKYSIAIIESHQVSAAALKMQTRMARK
jgi:hypothetical protein